MNAFMKVGVLILGFLLGLSGCTTMPQGPSVAVMPAQGKPFDLFQQEDAQCRAWARQSLGPDAAQAGAQSMLGSAVVGTAVGAAIGGIAGGSRAAGSGAAVGLGLGSVAGAGRAQDTQRHLQRRYDIAYEQCMSAKGNIIPPQQTMTAPVYLVRHPRYWGYW